MSFSDLTLGAMLILAFGPLDWRFPAWLWAIIIIGRVLRAVTVRWISEGGP